MSQPPYSNAVEAFIFNENNELLIMRRRPNDPHAPGTWDIPGGRIDPGEDPFAGLAREVQEEAGLVVDIREPLGVHYFTRDDGQQITLIIFRCVYGGGRVTLSEEHTEYMWAPIERAKTLIHESFLPDIANWEQHYQSR